MRNKGMWARATSLMLLCMLAMMPVAYAQDAGARQAAQEAAFAHAEIEPETALDLQIKEDRDDAEFEIVFTAADVYYEYEVAADTSEILGYEMTWLDVLEGARGGDSKEGITREEAQEAALAHAELAADDVVKLKAELDRDDGITCYEVEFETGDAEYEYKISAQDAAVISVKVEFFGGIGK